MSSVSRLYSSKPVSEEVSDALNGMGDLIVRAINEAKAAGVPQGLVAAILAAHFHEETARMLKIRDGEE